MNKKFLSAILFGALMVTSTGTFVSCKDYDDDIDRIDKELTELKSQIAALQTTVDNGDYVTGVAKTADGKGITFTFSKGSPVTVTLDVKDGEPGKDAQKITFDKDGQMLIDNEPTGIYPAKDAEKAPVKIEGGFWYTLNDKGEYENSNIPVSGLTVAGSEADGWTLTVIDANGNKQEVKVPTAASLMSEFEIVGLLDDNKISDDVVLNYSANKVSEDWEGPKGTIAEDDYIVATAKGQKTLLVRMAPSSVDFTGQSFILVNSKGNSQDWLALNSAVAYNKVLARAAQKAGLYTFSLAPTVVKKADYKADAWKVDGSDISKQKLALQNEAGTFTSQFGIGVAHDGTKMDDATVKLNGSTTLGSETDPVEIDLNVDNKITFDAANAVYDAYIEYSNDDDVLFAIDHDNAAMTFKATQMPDSDTKAVFKVVVRYLNVNGKVDFKNIYVKVTKSLVDGVVYERTHKIVADATNNFFSIDLKSMTDKMSAENLAVFNRNALVDNTTFTVKDAKGDVVAGLNGVDAADLTDKGITPSFLKKDGTEVTDKIANATTVKFAIDNEKASSNFKVNTPYTIEVVYAGADAKLADATIKLTLTLPALKDMFVHQDGIWVNDIASAYMDEAANEGGSTAANKDAVYTIKNAFKSLKTTVGTSTFNAKPDDATNILGDYKSADLATLNASAISSTNIDTWAITLKNDLNDDKIDDLNDNGTQKGYKQNLTIVISNVNYLGYWSYGDETYSFTLKVMSPILEGKVYAVGNEVVIPSASLDGYTINDNHIKAHTYNTEVVYSIFSDTDNGTWKRKEIKAVTFKSGNEELFTVPENGTEYKAATGTPGKDGYVAAKNGSLTITKVSGTSIDTEVKTNIKVTVTDAWGYDLDQEVPVKITVKKN